MFQVISGSRASEFFSFKEKWRVCELRQGLPANNYIHRTRRNMIRTQRPWELLDLRIIQFVHLNEVSQKCQHRRKSLARFQNQKQKGVGCHVRCSSKWGC